MVSLLTAVLTPQAAIQLSSQMINIPLKPVAKYCTKYHSNVIGVSFSSISACPKTLRTACRQGLTIGLCLYENKKIKNDNHVTV